MSEPSSLPSTLLTRCVRLLGNGQYSVMLTDAGGGYSHWRDLAITRWREDSTCDDWGSFILLRDPDNGALWSPTRQPLGVGDLHVDLCGDRSAQFRSGQADLDSTIQVAVAEDCDAEVRRVSLHNRGDDTRTIELTSYAELVLGAAGADASHPAFAKLFVQTHWEPDGAVLLATRRKRSPDEADLWAGHCVVVDASATEGEVEYETDRLRFLGRCRPLVDAAAWQAGGALANTVGTVLDPIFSLRTRVRIAPGATVCVDFWTMAAESRKDVMAIARGVGSPAAATRAIGDAAGHMAGQDEVHGDVTDDPPVGVSASRSTRGDAPDDCSQLLAPLLYSDRAWRAEPEWIRRGRGGSPSLWGHSISGDRPIIVLRILDRRGCDAVQSLLRAQRAWRGNWLGVDVVVLNVAGDDDDDDAKAVTTQLESLKLAHALAIQADGEGAKAEVFLFRESDLDAGFRDGLMTVARVVLDTIGDGWAASAPAANAGDVEAFDSPSQQARCEPRNPSGSWPGTEHASPEFANGLGGFIDGGRAYHIVLENDARTPAPWINVVANADFGFIVSAEGGGYTWSCNSQQNPLTPWPNDPVMDAPNEILYLRDLDSGDLWSATPEPIRVTDTRYDVTHGKGWVRHAHLAHGIGVDLLQYVPVCDSIKLSRLRLHNRSDRTRTLSVTGYVQWALAPNGTHASPWIVTGLDAATGALFAHNQWREEFVERVAFIDLGGTQESYGGDRREFLGPFGNIAAPRALSGQALSGSVGVGLDPCGALQTRLTLEPNQCVEVVFALGDAASEQEARALVQRYREADLDTVLDEVGRLWNGILDTVQVKSPDRALDILLNDWLLYQSLGCRVWARSAYYQSSGAYGFRDQLQDVMSLCVSRPDLAREHIVRSAGRQFPEGDVQHWWLPPSGKGIRTRMSDDRLWLPYVAAHYVQATGDASVLDACLPFLEGDRLKKNQDEAFFHPTQSDQTASVYEHGARAIDASLELGAHGLPLIGTGDWNDGMNRVGEKGRGESVWLVWLLVATIDAYGAFAKTRGDDERLERWNKHAAALRSTVEDTGWDGGWYRRGYYDDGTPLGSAESQECRIDTIAQSWSAMAEASDADHVASAMDAVHDKLLRVDDAVALLFTPPFDDGPMDPGYIKGYPPGLRENGGQYTHGATWSVFAFARLGQGDRAGALFSMLNPIHHADSPDKVARYKVEPYVACADVYSVAPHVGRGGWTWYTGSGGWLYRAGLEALLGFYLEGDQLRMSPCIPQAWDGYTITYRHGSAHYVIDVSNPRHVQQGVIAASLDGESLPADPCRIPLHDDGVTHRVVVTMGPKALDGRL